MDEFNWTSVGTAIGGLGLLLLGMSLLTSGLKQAAGASLHRLLGGWTRTRLRGLATGALITAVIQSSSAVTVALIGFANAGLLSLTQAAWVVFGSNVGTTMTGWLVALIGLKVKVEAFALPFLGVGMLMRLMKPASRLGGLGEGIAGFGTLFVGLDLLRVTFSDLAGAIDLTMIAEWGAFGLLAGVGFGVAITTLMQSSSAAMAVILTASSQGVLSPTFAASLVIGANVGTTSTALLSTLGATPNARRLAILHVTFNLLTGGMALALLVPILAGISHLHQVAALAPSPAIDLALFHTIFNLLGVFLMWPLSAGLVRTLERRFRSAEENVERPQHLDDNVLSVPDLAARALWLELVRASSLGLELARDVLRREIDREDVFALRVRPVRRLLVEISEYSTRLNRSGLSHAAADALTGMLRAHEHLWTVLHILGDLLRLRSETDDIVSRTDSLVSKSYLSKALDVLRTADTSRVDFDLEVCRLEKEEHEAARRIEHQELFNHGLRGQAPLPATNQALQELAYDRRLVSRAWKLAATLHAVRMGLGETESNPAPPRTREPIEPEAS